MTRFEKLVLLEKLRNELDVPSEDLYAFSKAGELLERGWDPGDSPSKFLTESLPDELSEYGLTPGLATKVLTYL